MLTVGDKVRTLNNDLAEVIRVNPGSGPGFQSVTIRVIRPDRKLSSNKPGDEIDYEASNLTQVCCPVPKS